VTQETVERIQKINYHAARLLVLIAYCGSPVKSPWIKGRTLLAKFDFFLRYPAYLDKAARIRTNQGLEELMDYEINNVEARMIRYKYGPWDNVYYSILAYLIAKDLIVVEVRRNVEYFGLTELGQETVRKISETEAFQTLIVRAKVLKKLFPGWLGSSVKSFIYEHFPEIISLPLGKEI